MVELGLCLPHQTLWTSSHNSQSVAGSGYCFRAVRTLPDDQTRFWPLELQHHPRCPLLVFCLCPAFWPSGRAMFDTGAGVQSQWWVRGESDSLFWCWRLHLLLGRSGKVPERVRLQEGPQEGEEHFLDEYRCFRQTELFLKRHRRMKQPGEVTELWVDDD